MRNITSLTERLKPYLWPQLQADGSTALIVPDDLVHKIAAKGIMCMRDARKFKLPVKYKGNK